MSARRGPPRAGGGRGQPRRHQGGRGGQSRAPPDEAPRDTDAERRVNRERYLDALQAMTGQHVELLLRDQTTMQGIFHTVSSVTDTKFDFVLKGTKKQEAGGKRSGYTTLIVHSDQVVQLRIPSMVLRENITAGSFATDTDISGKSASHLVNRKLKQVDGSWLEAGLNDAGLGGTGPSDGRKWDQFEANERITGRAATFDESMYTTKLDPSKITTDMLERAVQLAKEIEDQDVHDGNVHLAEERGKAMDTSKYTEEELYSGVLRGPAGAKTQTGGAAAAQPAAKSKAGEDKKEEKKKPTFKFNPNAKPFSFNPDAKEFKPSFMQKKPANAGGGGAAAAPAAAPAAMPPQPVAAYPVAAYPPGPPRGPPGAYEGMQYVPAMGYPMPTGQMPPYYHPQYPVMPGPGYSAGGGQFVGEYPMGGGMQQQVKLPTAGSGGGGGGGGAGSHTQQTENAS